MESEKRSKYLAVIVGEKIRLLANSESARRPDQLTGGVNEYRYCRELGQLGLTSTSRCRFFLLQLVGLSRV